MERLKGFKSITSMVFVAAFISASYEIRVSEILFPNLPSVVPAVISGILGGFAGQWLANQLIKLRLIRRLIFGTDFVEGCYRLDTKPAASDLEKLDSDAKGSSSLLIPGVLQLDYDPGAENFKIHTERIGENGEPFSTYSELAYIAKDHTRHRYLNYFKLTHDEQERFGISHGTIQSKSADSKQRDALVLQIFTQDSEPRRQNGSLIDPKLVRTLCREYGVDWPVQYLTREGDKLL